MNILDSPKCENIYPLPFCKVKNETYFQFFTLIFLIIEIFSFMTNFVSLISSQHKIDVIILLIHLGMLISMGKVMVDYMKTNNYATVFSYYYSIIRLVVVCCTIFILILKSSIWGLFSTVFFTSHKHRKHYFRNKTLAIMLFILASSFSIYLNTLFYIVISRKKSEEIEADKSDKAHLSEMKSQMTEP